MRGGGRAVQSRVPHPAVITAVRTLKLTLAYDGTAYAGWQRQSNAQTVQALVEVALAEIEGRSVTAVGAGRTDAGVHARGQVVSVRLTHEIPPSALRRALNAKLPLDIRVVAVEEVASTFHARHSAIGKVYCYRIDRSPVADPMQRLYAWHVPGLLDLSAMDEAGRTLVGRHDFAAFHTAVSESQVRSTVRTVHDVHIRLVNAMLTIEIAGDGFLRHMVRTVVGTLVDVGRGRWPPHQVAVIIASRRRSNAGPTAPARGLCLTRVDFPPA